MLKTTSKGQGSETPFVLSLMIFVAFCLFMTTQIAPRYPEFNLLSGFDALLLGTSFIAIAGACVIATGLPCAAALIFFNALTFFTVGNTLVSLLVFLPLTVTAAYVISRLARGGG
jgi:type III secretory pathway component EscV